jgi:hypothetical protein
VDNFREFKFFEKQIWLIYVHSCDKKGTHQHNLRPSVFTVHIRGQQTEPPGKIQLS